jgi:hypothetical protein
LDLRLLLSCSLIRTVNQLLDSRQQQQFAQPLTRLAGEIDMPVSLVELRHDATHRALPALHLLQMAARDALDWLRASYWSVQSQKIADAREQCRELLQTYSESRGKYSATALLQACAEGRMLELLLPMLCDRFLGMVDSTRSISTDNAASSLPMDDHGRGKVKGKVKNKGGKTKAHPDNDNGNVVERYETCWRPVVLELCQHAQYWPLPLTLLSLTMQHLQRPPAHLRREDPLVPSLQVPQSLALIFLAAKTVSLSLSATHPVLVLQMLVTFPSQAASHLLDHLMSGEQSALLQACTTLAVRPTETPTPIPTLAANSDREQALLVPLGRQWCPLPLGTVLGGDRSIALDWQQTTSKKRKQEKLQHSDDDNGDDMDDGDDGIDHLAETEMESEDRSMFWQPNAAPPSVGGHYAAMWEKEAILALASDPTVQLAHRLT